MFKICFKNCHTWKICYKSDKNNIFFENFEVILKIVYVIFVWQLCVVYFLDILFLWEVCFHSICWLNSCISHENTITKAYIIGAKVIEIGSFGAFRLSLKLSSLIIVYVSPQFHIFFLYSCIMYNTVVYTLLILKI